MKIDYTNTAIYNTIMAVAVGIALLLIVQFISKLRKNEIAQLDGWAMGFAVPGFILTLTGAHMSLTWPLSKIGFPFDDIIFGEPSLAFGVILLAIAILLWRRSNLYMKQEIDMNDRKIISKKLLSELPTLFKPLSYFGAAMGLGLIAIAIAGITYKLFVAPVEEPISGYFADYPYVEATFVSLIYAIIGIGAVLFPFTLKKEPNSGLISTVSWLWIVGGGILLLFGAMNYFTHIGLVVNTMT